jgi:hypothetical protein
MPPKRTAAGNAKPNSMDELYEKYYKEYNVTYENVLELNHKKMIEVLEIHSEVSSRIIFDNMIKEYTDMLRNKIN